MARALRSTSWIVLSYGGAQAIRLASNLILTRLLFPEAFGLMALIQVVIVGLTLFSDVGIGPSIAQSKRGDDRDFLNTAWTIQAIRGGCLWLAAC
ncbi:MAG TPA: polysaccharide biosynthesis protein, partial [Sulfitobacter sp.]|nr:polysaccharide biosynthesis protein [Sulfitobacter sp.]